MVKVSRKSLGIYIVLITCALVFLNISVFALQDIIITNPGGNGYFLQSSESYPSAIIRATVSGNPTSVQAYYVSRTSNSDNTLKESLIGTLTREGSTNCYSGTFTFQSWFFPHMQFPNRSVFAADTPHIKIYATDSAGTDSQIINAVICKGTMETYKKMDDTFFYTNETSNSFMGAGTGHPTHDSVNPAWTYNCLSFALQKTCSGWLWPWSGNPSNEQLKTTMSEYGYTICSRTPIPGAAVIYYSGGHFARVIEWDADEMPKTIISKWGGMELIKSNSTNPFTSSRYKSAYYYFKPAASPGGLPESAEYNEDTGNYYDMGIVDWDSVNKQYKIKEASILKRNALFTKKMTKEEWVDLHKDSTNPVDKALIKYYEAYKNYSNKHPEILNSSKWEVGEDGPLKIITDLGIEKLPQLIGYVQKDNPFTVPVMIAIEKIAKTRIGDIDPSDSGVISWKRSWNTVVANSESRFYAVVKNLKGNKAADQSKITSSFQGLGIFALPFVYNEVVNKSNTALAKYADYYLPKGHLKAIKLQQELAGYKADISVIKGLLNKK